MASDYEIPGFGEVTVGTRVEIWGGDDGQSVDDWGEVTELLPNGWVRAWWHMDRIHIDSEVAEIADLVVTEYSEEVMALINRERDIREGRGGTA
ncbi:MAG: hypothetical protein OXD40_02000 [bacterium]|nr:hypothetical protein [bacterium]